MAMTFSARSTTQYKTISGTDAGENLYGTSEDETIVGQAGDDAIYGGDGDDLLQGGAGDDYLNGEGGQDTLDGGAGYDRISHYYDTAAVTVDLAAGVAIDGNGVKDVLKNIESVSGSLYGDTLVGNDENNSFAGYKGYDTIDGGGGTDWLRYDIDYRLGGTKGIVVNLAQGSGYDGWGNRDTISNFENVETGDANDSVTGDAGDNYFWLSGGNDTAYGRAGDDSLYGKDGNDLLDGGAGDDYIRPGAGVDTINGGEGSDELSYADAGAVSVDMVSGIATEADGNVDTFESIESVQGSSEGDSIIGDDGDNLIAGLNGSDTLEGGAGFDRLSFWTEDYYGATDGVTVDLSAGIAIDGWGNTDFITGFEQVEGGDFDDTIAGDSGDNRVFGNDGDDLIDGAEGDDSIDGGDGNDTINGGSGEDWLSYFNSSSSVVVRLGKGASKSSEGDVDLFKNFENVYGSNYKDKLFGNAKDNVLSGHKGNDVLNGLKGSDTVSYEYDAQFGGDAGVTINLGKRFGVDGFGDRDKLVKIENAIGSTEDDLIRGSKKDNQLEGLEGDDRLLGLKGADTLVGGAGNDKLRGGAGADTFVFGEGFGADVILDFKGQDVLQFEGVSDEGDSSAFLAAHGSAVNGNYIIEVDGNSLTLKGVTDAAMIESALILL
ncbi:hypothetical protein [Donghicola sp. XS_ASV15]|uniref:calcium-binding protein n=1 Tax=Donghicola sp. XS_ASV15 TaxID=3241295 RepID=UPI003518CBB2